MATRKKKKDKTDADPTDDLKIVRGHAGHVTFLRVHELGTGFGGGRSNAIDAEVIFRLDSHRTQSFGFQLRDDEDLPVRRGMLDLLRDAMTHGLLVRPEYLQRVNPPTLHNCFVVRIELERPPNTATLASG